MPDCSYCGESFDDDQAHLVHLREEHEGELGTIDKRRVDEELDPQDDGEFPTGPVVLGIVLAVAVAIVGYVIFIAGGTGGATDPRSVVYDVRVGVDEGGQATSVTVEL